MKEKQETSLYQRIKHRYHLNDYYANSVVQAGKALLSSQQELRKMYLTIKEEQQKATKKKIKITKSRLTTLRKIKASFVKGKPKFNKTSPEQRKGRYYVVEYKGKTDLYYNQNDFEHLYLDVQLERLEGRWVLKKSSHQCCIPLFQRRNKVYIIGRNGQRCLPPIFCTSVYLLQDRAF